MRTLIQLRSDIKKTVTHFSQFYRRYRLQVKNLQSVRYRICSTIEAYQQTNKVQLVITDKPGDQLPPLFLKEIKTSTNLISGMHPIDVNSINDLYYIEQDHIVELKIRDTILVATDQRGRTSSYDIRQSFNPHLLPSKRLAYMIGYMQAEKYLQDHYRSKIKFKVVKDNVSSLYVEDIKTGQLTMKSPMDILFSKAYQQYSQEDIARIGYICGQMSKVRS